MYFLKQSTAKNILVLMIDSADHISGKTGLTLTITASKAGAAFASISPTVTERTNGWYQIALTSSHTDTLGQFCLHITGTGADPFDREYQVLAIDIEDAVRLGLSALPNAAAAASGGLLTVGTSSGQINPSSGGVQVASYASGQTPLQPTVAGRTLDVSAGGEAGIDLANVGSPTTTLNLSGTTVGVVTALGATAKADVNAEVVDCLNVDAYSEPTSAPAQNASLAQKIGFIFALGRNKMDTNRSTGLRKLYRDDGSTTLASATDTDDTTTFTKSELA